MRNDSNIPRAFNLLRWFSFASLLRKIPVDDQDRITRWALDYLIQNATAPFPATSRP